MMHAPAGTPCYFASWTGYFPPLQPHNPIDYRRAEASRAFAVFVLDEQERPLLFEKWLTNATPQDPSALDGRGLPAGRIFFALDDVGGERPSRLLSLDETRSMADYFRAHVHPDGMVATLERVQRERTMHHEYRYWEDGQLREFRYFAGDELRVDTFDREGNPVRSSTERSEG